MSASMPQEMLASLVAENLEMDLSHLAASIRSLGSEYARVYDHTRPMTPEQEQDWRARAISQGETTAFLPAKNAEEPEFQAPLSAFLVYRDGSFSPDVWRELAAFEDMAPLFRLAFETFDYSWVYLATSREDMTIYPYLPLSEAVNNYPPTRQVFYTAADFEKRSFGWTEPYLDLVGAGMMVTVSWPVYLQDKLLGVVSRDITLKQLSSRVLAPVAARGKGLTGIIVDKNGLVIANSDGEALAELTKVNEEAKAAVLHYRRSGLAPGAVASANEIYNRACEQALALAKGRPNDEFWRCSGKSGGASWQATATSVGATGWLVVILSPAP